MPTLFIPPLCPWKWEGRDQGSVGRTPAWDPAQEDKEEIYQVSVCLGGPNHSEHHHFSRKPHSRSKANPVMGSQIPDFGPGRRVELLQVCMKPGICHREAGLAGVVPPSPVPRDPEAGQQDLGPGFSWSLGPILQSKGTALLLGGCKPASDIVLRTSYLLLLKLVREMFCLYQDPGKCTYIQYGGKIPESHHAWASY